MNTPTLRFLDAGEPASQLISSWLRSYVTKPHPELGRPGAVCPFVGQALAGHKVSIACCELGAEPQQEHMLSALEQGANWFHEQARGADEPDLTSLIVAFPDLAREHWHLIDDSHREVKTRFVESGLMLGQFHPECEAPAAHNAAFPVNRGPVPLMVIRRMAAHDILFLEGNPVWVGHYTAWLARRKITVSHPLYRQRLDQALGKGT